MYDHLKKIADIKTGIYKQEFLGNHVTINDIRDKEYKGEALTEEENSAIRNFEVYRLRVLNEQTNDEDFHKKYQQLQVISNLGSYTEFLRGKFAK
jgi:hypothetical protein